MRLMLVDDDPFSIDKIKSRISEIGEQLGHAFEIVSECYSGSSALEQMPIVHPDAVFTDIQMSSVSGIELAKTIQNRWPAVPVVIFSAYPTFEYAREAMRANVVEYLLKPIDSAALKDVLQKLLYLNRNKIYMQSQEVLHSIISGELDEELPDSVRQALFPYTGYRLLLIQNVDALYDVALLMPKSEMDYDPLREQLNAYLEEREKIWIMPSDDRKSIVLIFGVYGYEAGRFAQLLKTMQTFFTHGETAPSIIYSGPFAEPIEIKGLYRRLYAALSERTIIGRPQLLALEEDYAEPAAQLSPTDEKRVVTLLLKNDAAGLHGLILNLISLWEKNDCTRMIAEINLKRILHLFEQHYRTSTVSQFKTLETRIEELVYTSRSFGELAEAFMAMLASSFRLSTTNDSTKESIQLFDRIELYIASNIGQPLSLQVLTDHFHVSRTVICNLFRDYSGKSYVEYITGLRMRMAQDLMRDYPAMLNKEIAEIVGYTDQNYFSHVFKTVTEMSPTKYREHLQKSGPGAS